MNGVTHMLNTLNRLIIAILCTASANTYAEDLANINIREIWNPVETSTVKDIVNYIIEPTEYRIFLEDASASRIGNLSTAYYPDGEVKPMLDIILNVLPAEYKVLIDKENKLISFL